MKKKTENDIDPRKGFAAETAKDGVIGVLDLSLLTGVPDNVLTSLARRGILRSYSEYHGKRFFKFEEVIEWATSGEIEDEGRALLRKAVEAEAQRGDCPYMLEEAPAEDGKRIVWKENLLAA